MQIVHLIFYHFLRTMCSQKFTLVANYVQIYFALYMINKQKHCLILLYCRLSILSERVEGLPPISKHREELKIQGEAEYFLTKFEVF